MTEERQVKAPTAVEPSRDTAKPQLTPVELGDPKVFARLGSDGRLVALRADVTLYEKLGHLYSIQGKTSITAAGYAKINSICAINVITPTEPKLKTDNETGRLKSVEVRKMAVGFSPSGTLVCMDSTLVFDLDAYRLHELANLSKRSPGAVKFLLSEQVAELKAAGKHGWVVPYENPVMLWVDISNDEVRDALIADSQRRKFAERIASTICWRNAIKNHPAVAQAQVQTSGADRAKTATVRVYGFRHDLDHAAMQRLATGIVEGKLDIVKEQLKAVPGASQEVHVEHATLVAATDDVEAVAAAVAEEEDAAPGGEQSLLIPAQEEPQEDRERLFESIKIGAEALNDQHAFMKLMADAGITVLPVATVSQLQQLNEAVSKEVDAREAHQTHSQRAQRARA